MGVKNEDELLDAIINTEIYQQYVRQLEYEVENFDEEKISEAVERIEKRKNFYYG